MTSYPTLTSFLTSAAAEVAAGVGAARFVELRYDVLNSLYPHPVFGVNQATPEFFATTLAYVTGARPIPESEPGAAQGADPTYWRRYRDWCRVWAVRYWQK